jgi:aminoglycoside phosphotransferase (APT) family kinase protein
VTPRGEGHPVATAAAVAIPGLDPGFLEAVKRLLFHDLSCPPEIRSVSRAPNRFAGRSPSELVTVELTDGSVVRLFVKCCGGGEQGHPDKSRPDRELLVYRDLLTGHDLPVPTFYGSRELGCRERYELFLEQVEGWNLKYQDLEHWRTAASQLARLHAHFAARADVLRGCRFLLELDRRYFAAWARRAQVAVAAVWDDLGRALARALHHHDEVLDLLTSQPPTLVHNDLAPKNVLAETSASPARICFVDWELAGLGCGALDLVHLTHGLPRQEEATMISAYFAELAGTSLDTSPTQQRRLIAACALQNTLYRLAHVEAWRLEHETAEHWVEDLARLRSVF